MSTLLAISPLDGRYNNKIKDLSLYFSEYALIKYRILIEIQWLITLSKEKKIKEIRKITKKEEQFLINLYKNFTLKDAQTVKEIESKTNHDVKAVEYFLKKKLPRSSMRNLSEMIHFACTSEDINNLAYALTIKESLKNEIVPNLNKICNNLKVKAKKYASIPMLGKTHGQSASSTTVGKEFANFCFRLNRQINHLKSIILLGKMNGAVGNFNAHIISYPDIDWASLTKSFLQKLGLMQNPYTTQIEPHDFMAELFDNIKRINSILIDLARDIWSYISFNYFKQKVVSSEVGSSTMPHKVNPIDFENSEGNLGIANSMLIHLSSKLPISRLQRDLSDSTVLRNIGSTFGYSLLAYKSLLKGLDKIDVNKKVIQRDLENSFEILAEPIQIILKKCGVKNAYEKLKAFTRGKKLDKKEIKKFISNLDIPKSEKKKLENLTPSNYIGLAEYLAKNIGKSAKD